MSRIKQITRRKIRNERLYNLSVEIDETFIANDIIVHNCDSWMRAILKGNLVKATGRNGKKGQAGVEKLKPSTKKIEDTIQFSDIITAVSHCCCSNP